MLASEPSFDEMEFSWCPSVPGVEGDAEQADDRQVTRYDAEQMKPIACVLSKMMYCHTRWGILKADGR